MNTYPDTVILMHRGESPKKCSVAPLRGFAGLNFIRYPMKRDLPSLTGYVRLGISEDILTPADAAKGLLLLDANWRHAEAMEKAVEHLPVRGLPPLKTAYPRVSGYGTDPKEGLATVEALYAAWLIQGRPVKGLLDHYHWKDPFLRLNQETLEAAMHRIHGSNTISAKDVGRGFDP